MGIVDVGAGRTAMALPRAPIGRAVVRFVPRGFVAVGRERRVPFVAMVSPLLVRVRQEIALPRATSANGCLPAGTFAPATVRT
jgi:hypothetical protein